MRILIIDNYDSFTYNLSHSIEKIIDKEVDVWFNDQINFEQILLYDKLILSPGPGLPSEAGMLNEVIRFAAGKLPILGVCLGHQAIAEVFGATLKNLDAVQHGVSSILLPTTPTDQLYKKITQPIWVGRYHSWVVDAENLPENLLVTATDDRGDILSFRHKSMDINGVQFHPESILTPHGDLILTNWIFS
jgi:anthranilate synthase component 2